jgi:hypothetical protein
MEAILPGSADVSVFFRLRDSSTGLAKTGLAFDSAGASAYYTRQRAAAVQITLATLATPSVVHSDGGFVEVDATNAKGLYRLDLPDAAVASGSRTVCVSVEFDGVIEETKEVYLGTRSGEDAFTGTLTIDDGASNGLEGAIVNATRSGLLQASGTTDANGEITDWALGPYTYDLAVRLASYQPATDSMTISASGWTKTVSLTAISISSPAAASLCTVSFQVKLSDTAVSGAVCKAKLQGINQASDGTILSNVESSDTTDAQGEAELQLVRKDSIVKGSGIYRIWIEIDGKPVASVETDIPAQSTIYFEDLLRS